MRRSHQTNTNQYNAPLKTTRSLKYTTAELINNILWYCLGVIKYYEAELLSCSTTTTATTRSHKVLRANICASPIQNQQRSALKWQRAVGTRPWKGQNKSRTHHSEQQQQQQRQVFLLPPPPPPPTPQIPLTPHTLHITYNTTTLHHTAIPPQQHQCPQHQQPFIITRTHRILFLALI